ncbi:MAG: hypothetical protein ABJA67_16030 [Chthonomonadales bacterium]
MSGFFKKLFGRFGAQREQGDADPPIGDLKAGALYSFYKGEDDANFGMVKILVLEPEVVHIRVYNNNFKTRPAEVDPKAFASGGHNLDDLDNDANLGQNLKEQGFCVGHIPIHRRDFVYAWQPVFMMDSPVTEDELDGYNIWKQEGGGVFGGL